MASRKTRKIADGEGVVWNIERGFVPGDPDRSPHKYHISGPVATALDEGTYWIFCNVCLKFSNFERNKIYYVVEA